VSPSTRATDGGPNRGRMRLLRVALALVVLGALAGGAYGAYYLFLRPSGPAAVSLASLPPVASTRPAPSGGLAGTWKVDTSIGSFADSSGSFVGYRVQEQLATLGAHTAVGRTPDVSGTLTLAGPSVTAVEVTADLTSLKSDDDRRDGQLRRQGIQSGTFPTAKFSLTSPIDLGSTPADGQTIQVQATGDLTLHGQTRRVQVPLSARLSGGVIAVTGSLPIVFADYGIQKPSSVIVLSIADQGTMELQLMFTKA
jgi:polyisoprenoid-binding protein YceI